MKLHTFDQFVRLPPGTIFSYWSRKSPCGETLFIKGETIRYDNPEQTVDFWERSLLPRPDKDYELPVPDESETRWGMYDYDQEFVVYEADDLRRLAYDIAAALNVAAG